jgi:cystathionine gamma-synthase
MTREQRPIPKPRTSAVRTGLGGNNDHGAVAPPLHLSATFTYESFGVARRHDYTRTSNPTRDILGQALADLEGGIGATVTGSGMAAITLVCQLLEPGDLLVAPHDCYGGTHRLLNALGGRGQFEVRFVDLTDPEQAEEAISAEPALVLVETPSNPLLRITDIEAIAGLCRENGSLLAVDNTFLSPALQRPISLGADLVIHSTTKYLNGHSDMVGGAVIANDVDLHLELQWWANCLGLSGAPFDSYMTLRGIRTLHPRIRFHEENTAAVVDLLVQHPAVAKVHYPGLEDHPGHEIATRQQDGYGAMVSFELDCGVDQVAVFLDNIENFFLAESLGGVESLVAHPATMTHSAMDPQARERAQISDRLIRLSVGIEDPADLVGGLTGALEAVLVADPDAKDAVVGIS